MEEDIKKYLPNGMFCGTPCMFILIFTVLECLKNIPPSEIFGKKLIFIFTFDCSYIFISVQFSIVKS